MTDTAAKLGIKAEGRVQLYWAPRDWSIPDMPPGAHVERKQTVTSRGNASSSLVLIGFFGSRDELVQSIAPLAASIFPAGSLWIAWPRRAGGHTSDLTDQVVRDVALHLGIVDVKVAAIDNNWSGLRFVWRKELRNYDCADVALSAALAEVSQ